MHIKTQDNYQVVFHQLDLVVCTAAQLDIIQHWVQSVQQLHQVYQEEPVYHSSKIFNFCDVMKKRESVFVKIKFKKK